MLFREFTQGDLMGTAHLAYDMKLPFWLEGGWGVDVLLGRQTRWHSDLDMMIESRYSPVWIEYLEDNGWELLRDEHTTPWSRSYGDPKGRVYDIHVLELDADGNGHCGPELVYPAAALRVRRPIYCCSPRVKVGCLSPKWQVRFHTGYPVDEDDWADVSALCQRFRVRPPAEYARFVGGDD